MSEKKIILYTVSWYKTYIDESIFTARSAQNPQIVFDEMDFVSSQSCEKISNIFAENKRFLVTSMIILLSGSKAISKKARVIDVSWITVRSDVLIYSLITGSSKTNHFSFTISSFDSQGRERNATRNVQHAAIFLCFCPDSDAAIK